MKINTYQSKNNWRTAWFLISRGFFILLSIFILTLLYFSKDLPNPNKLDERKVIESTKIYDRTGQVLLYDIHGEEKRTIIPFNEIPDYIKNATLVAEDANFYKHFGIDFKGMIRGAWLSFFKQKTLQSGSTITQQFIKNSFLTSEKTFTRKIKEIILAVELEIKYSKDEILGFYLNEVPYGSNSYGIEAASQTFFNKKTKDLTLAESTLLASLTKAPSYYSPYGSHPEDLKNRQEYILDRMVDFNYISREQAAAAKQEPLNFNKTPSSIKAPHFVMYIKEYLEEKYGKDMIEKSGLKVITTLDWDLEQKAEQIIKDGATDNQKKYSAYNAALVAIDPKTGQILSMVGSKNYFEDSLPNNCISGKTCKLDPNVNITIRNRQPGSSFKPFAYAMAFKKGYTPDTILFDLQTEFNTDPNGQSYQPQNYDGKFRGPVTMRAALSQSLNIPSVKTLYLAGIPQTIDLSREMGITTLTDKTRYGLALVLGGGEVKLLDETAAYGVFAADGIKYSKTAILKITDNQGQILEEYKNESSQVLESQAARLINSVLSDNQARTPVFGSTSPLYLAERPVAAKTGTTQEYRDAWTIGYTPSLVVGVWTGNNDNSGMTKTGAGLYAAAPLWNKFMKEAYLLKSSPIKIIENKLLENEFKLPIEVENFIAPEPINTNKPILNGQFENEIKVKIDKISGKLATNLTPPELIEEKIYKEIHNILYFVDKNNPEGDIPNQPKNDPQFLNWENPVLEWAKSFFINNEQYPPTDYDNIHKPENQPKIKIIFPTENTIIKEKYIQIQTAVSAPLNIKQLDLFFDNNFIGTISQSPYNFKYNLPINLKKGTHIIKVKIYDMALNANQDEIMVFIN